MRKAILASLILAPMLAFATPKNYDVAIEGMTCDSCVKSVTSALSKVPNVDAASVKVNLKGKKATVTMKEDNKETVAAVKKAIEDVGFKVTAVNPIADTAAKKN